MFHHTSMFYTFMDLWSCCISNLKKSCAAFQYPYYIILYNPEKASVGPNSLYVKYGMPKNKDVSLHLVAFCIMQASMLFYILKNIPLQRKICQMNWAAKRAPVDGSSLAVYQIAYLPQILHIGWKFKAPCFNSGMSKSIASIQIN